MSVKAACPVCGHIENFPDEFSAETCKKCGALLGAFDLGLPASTSHAKPPDSTTSRPGIGAHVGDFVAAVFPKALLIAGVCAVGAAGVAVLLAPVLGEHLRAGIGAAAFFGGQVGLVFGFLWFALEYMDARLLGAAVLGIAIGLVIGVANVVALQQTDYLPEVSPLECFLVGVIAGPVTAIFLAMFRGND